MPKKCSIPTLRKAADKQFTAAGSANIGLAELVDVFLVFVFSVCAAQAQPGATVPWTTYEAEAMTINGGTILGPPPIAVDKNVTVTNTLAGESSGQQCVELQTQGSYAQFTAQGAANALVVRYSVPDTAGGGGANYTISLYTNGVFSQKIPVTSLYSWLYGAYPFANTPSSGSPRNFFNEARLMNLSINPGDQVRLQIDPGDTASFYIIDLVDLENVGPAVTQPANSLSVKSAPYNAVGNGTNNDTSAIQNCINAAESQGKIVWMPPGNYLVQADLTVANVTIQGAGMWYTTLVGNPAVYNSNANARVRFDGNGSNIHLYDFAILGCLDYRNDSEANDSFQGFYGTNSSIQRCWVEHTKTGFWIANSKGMLITDCRIRDTIADGINLCVGCNSCLVSNCTTRGTGDDCFPIWPATYTPAVYQAGYNVITHCTAQSPWFANGGAIYGGVGNCIENCFFQDIPDGAGILIAGEFTIGTNLFSGTTVAQNCNLNRCGGNDPGWRWRGALTICPQNNTVSNVNVNNLNISNSLSYGVQFLDNTVSNISVSNVNISGYALQVQPFHPSNNPATNVYVDGVFGVLARNDAKGSAAINGLTIDGSNIVSLPYPVTTNADTTNAGYPYPGTFITNESGGNFTFSMSAAPVTVTVAATAVSSSQINLSWTTGSGAISYDVERATVSGGPYTNIATGVTTINYSDTGLAASTTYYYVVSAVNSGGGSTNSAPASATTSAPSPPLAPTGLIATPGTAQIALSWTASSGATSYNAKRATVSGGPYSTIATGVTATNYVNTGLTNGITYYFVVSAVNPAGESTNSSQASAIPTSTPFLLSQGQAVAASSYQSGNYPTNGNDGNLTNRWAASGSSMPQWWQVDLGANYDLTTVVIDWYDGSSRAYGYEIGISTDNLNFTTVYSNTTNTTFGNTTNEISALGRYVIITVTSETQSGGYASFYEAQVYGTVPSAALNPTNMLAAVSGNVLTLSWPADHLGWSLQVQTNAVNAGLGTSWVTMPGSALVTSTNITINPNIGAAFYRLFAQ